VPLNWYATYDLALRRVEVLKGSGIWPGIIGPDRDGAYALMFNPDLKRGPA
jgi:hypothetical protein